MATKKSKQPVRKGRGTTPPVVIPIPPDLALALSRFDALIAALKKHKGLVAKAALKEKPLTEEKLAAWEKKSGVALPADYRTFLALRGPFSLEWSFKRKTAYGETIGADIRLKDLPEPHPFLKDKALASTFKDLWVMANGEAHRWCWRFRKGEASKLVLENLHDDGSLHEGPSSFSEWLSQKSEWGFASLPVSGSPERHVPLADGDVRSFPALESFLFVRPPLDPTDPQSLVAEMKNAEYSSGRTSAVEGLVALRAIETAPEILAFVESLLKKDVGEAAELLVLAWRLDRISGVELARRILAKPPKGDEAPYVIAMAHVFLASGGDATERKAARKALLDVVKEYIGYSLQPTLDVLLSDGSTPSVANVLHDAIDGCTKHYGSDGMLRIARALAEKGDFSGFDRMKPILERAAVTGEERNDEYGVLQSIVDRNAKGVFVNVEDDLEGARKAALEWLADIVKRAKSGESFDSLPVHWESETYVVKIRTRPTIDNYAAPELVEEIEFREPKNPEAMGRFVNARNVKIFWQDGDETPLDVRHLAPLARIETLEIDGYVTPEANLEELSLPSLRSLHVRGDTNDGIQDAGLKRLLKALPSLPKLERLSVPGEFGKAGYDALAKSPVLPKLKELVIDRDAEKEVPRFEAIVGKGRVSLG